MSNVIRIKNFSWRLGNFLPNDVKILPTNNRVKMTQSRVQKEKNKSKNIHQKYIRKAWTWDAPLLLLSRPNPIFLHSSCLLWLGSLESYPLGLGLG